MNQIRTEPPRSDESPLAPSGSPPVRSVTRPMIMEVLASPERLKINLQPIVDLQSGMIAGYEALSRFTSKQGIGPEAWFSSAAWLGVAADLEAVAISNSLALSEDFPTGCFLSVNVSPDLISSDPIHRVLSGSLQGIVVELTEHVELQDFEGIVAELDELRDRGAMIAVDDTGSGYSGLQMLTKIRPEIVKLDRELVAGIDTDDVKAALAQMLGEFVGLLDGWMLAEGVETIPELDRIVRMGIPLAQGWVLGHPGPPFVGLDETMANRIRQHATDCNTRDLLHQENLELRISHLVEQTATFETHEETPVNPNIHCAVKIDQHLRPVEIFSRPFDGSSALKRSKNPTKVKSTETTSNVLERVMLREHSTRFDPVVVVDSLGRHLGTVRVESMIAALLKPNGAQQRSYPRPLKG